MDSNVLPPPWLFLGIFFGSSCCIHSVILKHQDNFLKLGLKTYKLFGVFGQKKKTTPLATTKRNTKKHLFDPIPEFMIALHTRKTPSNETKKDGRGRYRSLRESTEKTTRISDFLDGFFEMPRLQLKCLDWQHYHNPGGGSTKICG